MDKFFGGLQWGIFLVIACCLYVIIRSEVYSDEDKWRFGCAFFIGIPLMCAWFAVLINK